MSADYRSTVSAAGEPGWDAAMQMYPERSMRADIARAAFSAGFAAGRDYEAASPAGPEAVPQSEPPDPLATVHVVEFTEDGYGLQHPASCRPNLIDCRYNTYLTSLFQPEREPGRYVMTLAGEHAEYTPVEEVGAVPQSEREGLPSVDELAQIIREVDGDHSLGAGALAESILARLASPAHPDEPRHNDADGEMCAPGCPVWDAADAEWDRTHPAPFPHPDEE